MDDGVPSGARAAARVLVLSGRGRLLLLQGVNVGPIPWWVSPGGGLRDGETFEEAAARELFEETGIRSPIGPCVWTRHHRFEWYGKPHNQFERFFVASTGPEIRPAPRKPDGYIMGHRWWTVREIQTSSAQFSPRRLGTLLPPIVRGEYPSLPLDAGV